jgi:HlyD family secretion protein
VRFSSFNRRTTPELNGNVTEIGADATQDEKRNESYYSVRIRIPDSEFERLDELQPLSGMPVETFIETSPRTVVSYLMRPMLEQMDRTFRGR